jgi:exodeoxyribonuclease VII small subunit
MSGNKTELIKFEHALGELEKIIVEMEGVDLPLEKLIERYEQGMRLVKICGDKLTEAEQKIEVLTKSHPDLTNGPANSDKSEKTKSPDLDKDNETQLF